MAPSTCPVEIFTFFKSFAGPLKNAAEYRMCLGLQLAPSSSNVAVKML